VLYGLKSGKSGQRLVLKSGPIFLLTGEYNTPVGLAVEYLRGKTIYRNVTVVRVFSDGTQLEGRARHNTNIFRTTAVTLATINLTRAGRIRSTGAVLNGR